jgi:hypothetical protein
LGDYPVSDITNLSPDDYYLHVSYSANNSNKAPHYVKHQANYVTGLLGEIDLVSHAATVQLDRNTRSNSVRFPTIDTHADLLYRSL